MALESSELFSKQPLLIKGNWQVRRKVVFIAGKIYSLSI